ncbi:membrane-associated protein, putative [Bodo saltans]|uniref:Membrane-associated protein, putative n=1 Tax=Bodo saltans TaxID=75058 RepID=A0A0S4KIZ7_BODSA|nr:membrane-associated protein, putative [Bodo saltans]|eukprot:CUI14949.1 membrane-associated protein, putative [Bodo saltans]
MLIMVVVFAYAWLGRTSIILAVEALGVPSPLFPLVVMTIPSTAALTLLLSSIAVTCEVCFLFGNATSVDGQAQLQTAAAVCDLAVSGVSMLKAALDVFEALRACRRHIIALLRRHRKISAAVDVSGRKKKKRRHDANGIATSEELLVDDQQGRWELL